MKKEWKIVGDYEVCWQENRIKRVKPNKQGAFAGKELKVRKGQNGYLFVQVTIDGKRYNFYHQLVALAYHGLRPKGKEVNHVDANKENSNPKNLKYVTSSENHRHAVKMGIHRSGVRCNLSKLSESSVLDIRKRLLNGERSSSIAKIYGVWSHTIRYIARGKTWKQVA